LKRLAINPNMLADVDFQEALRVGPLARLGAKGRTMATRRKKGFWPSSIPWSKERATRDAKKIAFADRALNTKGPGSEI